MAQIDFIFSKESSEDITLKNLLREIKLEHPKIILNELEKDSSAGQKYVEQLGILSFPAIIINDELFSTGMVTKEEILEKIDPSNY